MANLTPRTRLPYILQSQAQKEVTHNQSLDLLDTIVQASAVSSGLNTPPASPNIGDCYILGSSPTGAWVGRPKAFAFYTSVWNFLTLWEGFTVWINDTNTLSVYDGTDWINIMQNIGLLGVNSTADSTNKFSVGSSAVLFNHIGNDVQIKINKNAVGDKASFLFQRAFSGRAEFGLLGDDNFTLKVSSNGSTFFDSLKMLGTSGRAALKANASGLSAAGSTQGTATILTKQTNEISTVSSGQGVVLPSPEQGDFLFIANSGASALNVYPASGHSINALSVNSAFALSAGKNAIFWAATTTKWYSNLSA